MPQRFNKPREWVCTNMECAFEGRIQYLPEGNVEEFCACGDKMKLVPEVTPEGVFISVREANVLRHFLMTEHLPHRYYLTLKNLLGKIDERLTNMGHPYTRNIEDD